MDAASVGSTLQRREAEGSAEWTAPPLSGIARQTKAPRATRSAPSAANGSPYLSNPGSHGPAEIPAPSAESAEPGTAESPTDPNSKQRKPKAALSSAATESPRRGRPRKSVLAPEQVVATAQSTIPSVEASAAVFVLAPEQTAGEAAVPGAESEAQGSVLAPEQTTRSVTVPGTESEAQDSVLAPEQTAQTQKRKNRRSQAAKPETALVLAPEQTEVLPADAHGAAWLPGEKHIDETLLDEAVAALNQIYLSKSQELHETLGDYLVQTFFSGDVTLFDSRERHHQTWRALSKREDLHFGHSTLWYAVAIRHQALGLTEEMVRALPVTHQRHLTHVRDPEQKQLLAERVVAEGLSERQLRDAIVDIRPLPAPDAPRRGRPPLPRLQKQLGVVSRALAAC